MVETNKKAVVSATAPMLTGGLYRMSKDILPQADKPYQLSLFDSLFDERIRRQTTNGRVRFSILDIFQHYGKAKNPTTSWKTALKFLKKQGFDSSREILELQFPGERQRKTPTATLDVILRIAQITEFKEWEHLRQWMAITARERIEEIADPELGIQRAIERATHRYQELGKSDTWIKDRLEAIDDYKLLCQSIDKVCTNPQYGVIVNSEYVGLFGMMASSLKVLLNTKSIRDALPELQLAHLHTAEISLRMLLERSDAMTTNAICEAAQGICQPLNASLKSISKVLGIHHITGQPLLNDEN